VGKTLGSPRKHLIKFDPRAEYLKKAEEAWLKELECPTCGSQRKCVSMPGLEEIYICKICKKRTKCS